MGAALLGLALAGSAALACHAPGTAARPPHVLLIVVDSLRRDRLGVHGHERPTSPAIDALARSGVVYTAALSTAPWTTPAVASILTSQLPSTLGVAPRRALSERWPLLAELLNVRGYATAAVVSHSYVGAALGFDRGFGHFDESHVRPAGSVTSPGVSDAAIAFLRERAGEQRPFFLFVHYFDPHFPYLEHEGFTMPRAGEPYDGPVRPGQPWRELRQLAAEGALGPADAEELLRIYDSEVAFTDAAIGRLLDALEAEGLSDETLVLLTSDHGEEFLDHGGLGHTRTLYGELVHVPLIVRYPASLRQERPEAAPGRRDDAPASLLDVLPTVLDVLGAGRTDAFAGASLLAPRDPQRPLFSESERGVSLRAVTRGPWKLIEDRQRGARELFDLREDGAEARDLARAPELAAVREELARALAALPAPPAPSGPRIEVSREERARLDALGYAEE